MDIFKFVKEHGHIIAAIMAGTFAITAAYIRRDRRWERSEGPPVFRLLLVPLLSILLGASCLAGEYYAFNLEPTGDVMTGDVGTILALVGCVLIAAGILWWPFNLYRLATWPRPAPLPPDFDQAPGSVPASSTPMSQATNVKKRPT